MKVIDNYKPSNPKRIMHRRSIRLLYWYIRSTKYEPKNYQKM